MKTSILAFIGIMFLTTALAGCTGGTDDDAGELVEMKNIAFDPTELTIEVGTKVTWLNRDTVAHTVTSDEGDELDSDNIQAGQKFTHTFDTAGTYEYHCTPHPNMVATIIVVNATE